MLRESMLRFRRYTPQGHCNTLLHFSSCHTLGISVVLNKYFFLSLKKSQLMLPLSRQQILSLSSVSWFFFKQLNEYSFTSFFLASLLHCGINSLGLESTNSRNVFFEISALCLCFQFHLLFSEKEILQLDEEIHLNV